MRSQETNPDPSSSQHSKMPLEIYDALVCSDPWAVREGKVGEVRVTSHDWSLMKNR